MRTKILVYILLQLHGMAAFAYDEPVTGVSRQLAENRAGIISNVHYHLEFNIPDSIHDPVNGSIILSFRLIEKSADLVLDYFYGQNIQSITVNGQFTDILFSNEHIIISKDELLKGQNEIRIFLTIIDKAFNRHKDYLYSLLVPDKARMLFPCFDQPDLKGIFHVKLSTPQNWLSVSNGKIREITVSGNRQIVEFEPTEPVSTYVFAIASGKFKRISEVRGQRSLSLYYMENDSVKVKQNSADIFDAAFYALNWCSEYTETDYPFSKYDLVAIPSFQFSGMEHAGAVFFRDTRLFLDANCTREDKKSRSNLIFHETAHMWFGDLVTMKWFDEVWLKEVFANYITDKINAARYNDERPEISFLLRHYPSAYSIDRSLAPNAISQELNNLNNAGSLYGPIIYDKAPIVVNILEDLVGQENLKESLRLYLKRYSYGNAGWDELIEIIEEITETRLKVFSNSWIKTRGMPCFRLSVKYDDKSISGFKIIQYDKFNRNIFWEQSLSVALFYKDTIISGSIISDRKEVQIDRFKKLKKPLFTLLNATGNDYGYFEMDRNSISYLADSLNSIKSPLIRSIVWINLFENLMSGNIRATEIASLIIESLLTEENIKIQDQLLSYLEEIYWHYLTQNERATISHKLEDRLWTLINTSSDELNILYFNSLIRVFTTRETSRKLFGILKGEKTFTNNFKLSDRNYADLAYELATRNYQSVDSIRRELVYRIQSGEIRDEAKFIFPALSESVIARDSVFSSFLSEGKVLNENQVIKSLSLLIHPLKSESARKYIQTGLESAVSKKSNGSLFFSQRWIETLLSGFTGENDIKQITDFLIRNPDYPQDLKMKIIQSADHLFRLYPYEKNAILLQENSAKCLVKPRNTKERIY